MAFGAISAFLCGGASPPVKSRCRQGIHFRTQVVPGGRLREEVQVGGAAEEEAVCGADAICGGRFL